MAIAEIIEMPDGWFIVTCPLCGFPIDSGIGDWNLAEALDFHIEDRHKDWVKAGCLHYEKKVNDD